MTIETYNKATKILKEKEELEKELDRLRHQTYSIDFIETSEKYIKICNELFKLGQEFAAL